MKINQHKIFLDVAEKISEMSHCVSHKVGCLIVKDGRIISTGYNGTSAGFTNCDDIFTLYDSKCDREKHHEFSEKFEIHAELNAILNAAKNGIAINNSILYCTLHPCYNCLKMICNSGINTIIYRYEYDKFENNEEIKKMLNLCNIKLISEKDLY